MHGLFTVYVKTIDKAAIATDRMKASYAKTKERAEAAYYADQGSPSEYALDKLSRSTEAVARESGHHFNVQGKKAVEQTKANLIKIRQKVKEAAGIKTKTGGASSIKSKKLIGKTFIKGNGRPLVKNPEMLKSKVDMKKAQQAMKQKYMVKKTAEKSYRVMRAVAVNARRTAILVVKAVKSAVLGIKALISAIIAGSWVAVIVIIICCLFGAAIYFFGDNNSSYTPVSAEVEAYSDTIEKYAEKFGISEYEELIKAVMMQESGGRGKDPMQSSECKYNTKYPKSPGAITDPDYSIKCGIQYLAFLLKEVNCKTPLDMDQIKLALQAYNFGEGYISWALNKYGGYSKAGAVEFAKEKGGNYGDTDYVVHVLRYYPYGNFSYDIEYLGTGVLGLPIPNMTQDNISSHYGPRPSPGGIGSTDHKGLDIAFPMGTKIYACEKGTVVSAGYNNGLGLCVIISHGNNLQTVYGHMSKIDVKSGQKVMRGQNIGEVGSTGNSTGPHLHLGVKLNGKYVDPEKGYLSIPK